MLVRIESRHLNNRQILSALKGIKEFEFVTPVQNEPVLETDIDKAVEKGLKSKMTDEKNFEKSFKKHFAKWQKHFSR